MDAQSTNLEDRLSVGEKLFVFGVMLALVTQLFVSGLGLVIGFSWTGLLLAVVSPVLLLALVNPTYAGDRGAFKKLLLLVAVEVLIAASALIIPLVSPKDRGVAQALGLPALGLAGSKLVSYLVLGGLLLGFAPLRDLLAFKRGEQVTVQTVPGVGPSGVTFPLSDAETAAIDQFGSLLRVVGCLVALVGLLRLLQPATDNRLRMMLSLCEGVVLVLAGLIMQAPASAVKVFRREGPDVSFLMHVLGRLKTLFFQQTVIGLVLALVLVGGIVLRCR